MNILFVHQNFPGQYRHLAPALAARPGYRVAALRLGDGGMWQGVDVIRYQVKTPDTITGHPWLADLHPKMVRAEAAARQALSLREQGFNPDVIIGHPGWGDPAAARGLAWRSYRSLLRILLWLSRGGREF